MQHESAYYGGTYSGPTSNVQGLCPAGWHVPSGGDSGDFHVLHTVAGSPMTGFWQPDGNWQGILASYCHASNGCINYNNSQPQGEWGFWWTSKKEGTNGYYYSRLNNSTVWTVHNQGTNDGWGGTIRCIKNDFDCPAHCLSCSSANTCEQCETGYSWNGSACVANTTPPAIQILSFTPQQGFSLGGELLTIYGSQFTSVPASDLQVLLDNQPASELTVVNDSTIQVRSPAHAPGAGRQIGRASCRERV